MGMDVYGRKPTSEAGKYFRANVWHWHPLWDYCLRVAPELFTKQVARAGHFNDGAGLSADKSERLADVLQARLDSGECRAWEEEYRAWQQTLPWLDCPYCHASGVRRDAVGLAGKMDERLIDEPGHPRVGELGWCNGCNGWGKTPQEPTRYPFSAEVVRDFTEFLRHCGGFKIC